VGVGMGQGVGTSNPKLFCIASKAIWDATKSSMRVRRREAIAHQIRRQRSGLVGVLPFTDEILSLPGAPVLVA
jgi:hypothetical protein